MYVLSSNGNATKKIEAKKGYKHAGIMVETNNTGVPERSVGNLTSTGVITLSSVMSLRAVP